MDRPRRTTRSSLASSSGGTPATPTSSSNPYKKPTYFSRGETPVSTRNTNGTTPSGRGRGRGRGRPPGRNSVSGGRGGHHNTHTKPECIAVRVDGRRSTGGSTASSGGGRRGAVSSGSRRSTYTSRHDYEYHYGSDFESDQNETDPEDDVESEQESDAESVSVAGENNDNADSDSDFSVSSSRVTSSRLPSPPVPMWLDTEKVPELPKLEPPNSSEDLLLSREHVVKAVEIYEPLRRFHQLVRLSPFRFEDFCGALACDDQSSLLAEIHIQLLKSVIREEDANGTLYGPNEVKDSVQAVVYFIDYITWPESLRSYLESDSSWKDVHDELVSVEYPFCGPAVRIKVLGWLVDQFLTTNAVREQLLGDGNIKHEDHCRACNRLGELICCETCPAVYHLECVTPPLRDLENPPDEWKCPICTKHQLPGINDCISEVEKMGLLVRHERLGYDRHGRKYWFLVRRILVESEDGSEVWYYSTRSSVEELLSRLDGENYEQTLVENIKAVEEELYRQMDITEEVTRLFNTHRRRTYLDVESGKEESDGERMTRLKSSGLYKLGQEGTFRQYTNYFTTDPAALSKGKFNEERDRKRHMSHKFSLTPASECKYGIKDMGGCPRSTQIQALRGALSHMESALPTTLMHVNWPMLRKTWLNAVQNGASADDFSRAMIMISACIRNAVYNPVWSESTGHVRFIRMSLLEREERKKSEKREKKDKDDEEDRLKAVSQFIKYTIPIRHQVYKQKGEEYRLHGRWGWIWLSNQRQCKSQDCRTMGLLAGPHKHVIQVKNETGKVKTMLIDPGVYNKLMAKRNLATTTISNPQGCVSGESTCAPSSEATSSIPKSPDVSDELKPGAKPTDDVKAANGHDVEMKEESSDEKEESQTPDSSEVIKVKGETNDEKSVPENSENDINGDKVDEVISEDKPVSEESDKEKLVEPKTEPMDVDGETIVETTGETETKNSDSAEKSDEVEKVEEVDASKEEINQNGEPMDVEQTAASNDTPLEKEGKEEPTLNGTESSEEKEDEKEEHKIETTEVAAVTETSFSEAESATQASSVNTGIQSAAVPMTPDKQDDSQGRKFKTELINVSSGLASGHRLLYPKVARRCEYLDSLLHRRLTLMSLEEKQLRSTYGEEMVCKAKSGINQFHEEELKRKQEEEEYPGEEVIDPRLTLGGAYAFCCYSSECQKEAKLFMKGKGKNRLRLYEKICYSPMCRLKFCLQETTRIKQERVREAEKEKYYKVYKEIEGKREYTLEGTTHKVYMKRLPECLTLTPAAAATGVPAITAATSASQQNPKKRKNPATKYPQTSSFQYATSKKPSILVLPQYELKKLGRTAGRHFTPTGFFQNQKAGSWGWSYPCGRPVFRTAWQYRTTHSHSLAAAAMQLKILYASIKWDDIVTKIPNTDGKHQVHTDSEIVTYEILNHRIIGRFMERVQYLRKTMTVPIDAPKTIREITPSRIGLRKRKRAESPDKTEPVVTEEWVDEEKLELWEIRYYGDRIDRKHERRSESNTPSTRTKSGIAIKQPEKYDPSHNPTQTDKKTYPGSSTPHQPQNQMTASTSSPSNATGPISQDSLDKTIEHVVRNHDPTKGVVSHVKTAERMRETIETEMKMQRAVHLSKRDSHAKNNGTPRNGTQQATPQPQPTASQQFQQQLQQQSSDKGQNGANPQQRNIAQVAVSTPTTGKVGVVPKKFFAHRGSIAAGSGTPTTGNDAGLLTKRPYQNTITINKGAIPAIMKNNSNQAQQQQQPHTSTQAANNPVQGQGVVVAVSTSNANTNSPATTAQMQQQAAGALGAAQFQSQKLSLVRLPCGRVQVKGLLPGQQCYQGADGKIHVTVSAANIQMFQQQILAGNQVQTVSQIVAPPSTSEAGLGPQITNVASAAVSTAASVAPATSATQVQLSANSSMAVNSTSNIIVSTSSAGIPVASTPSPQIQAAVIPAVSAVQSDQQQLIVTTSQQQPVINISSQGMKSGITASTSMSTTTIKSPQAQTQPYPQQIIVQQQNGQHVILQGAAAQAVIQQQQQQQKLLQQRAAAQQVGTTSAQQTVNVKHVTTSAGKTPVIVSSSGSTVAAPTQVTVPGSRIVIQDGKALLITNPATPAQQLQQRDLVVGKQVIQATSAAQPQRQIIRSSVLQNQGQVLQGQSIQLIQGQGGQIHLVTQQPATSTTSTVGGTQQQQIIVQQTQTPTQNVVVSQDATTTVTSSGVVVTTPVSSSPTPGSTLAAPASSEVGTPNTKVNTAVITTAATTPVKHVLADGRTVLLSPSQVNDLQLAGGRKLLLNNKSVIQLPVSGTTALRTQPQIIQTVATSQPTIQIVQGPGGQQFLIHQPQQTALLQQAQQQQVQIVVPSGQLGGNQPVLVKKIVKSGTGGTSTSGSPIITKQGNVVQFATTAQNQLTQLLGANKTLVRLDNNQLAAIQLPVQQSAQVSAAPAVSGTTAVSSPTTTAVSNVTQPQAPTGTGTPPPASSPVVSNASTQQQMQQQTTTITRTPGLPISIVSPSKSKAQQQLNNQKLGTVQVVSSSPSTTNVVNTSTPSTPVSSPQVSKASTIIRLATPNVLRGASSPSTIVRPQSPAVTSASLPSPKIVTPTVPVSHNITRPIVLAHKSPANSTISNVVKPTSPVTSTPVIAVKSTPHQISSNETTEKLHAETVSTPSPVPTSGTAPVIVTARKSEPPPIQTVGNAISQSTVVANSPTFSSSPSTPTEVKAQTPAVAPPSTANTSMLAPATTSTPVTPTTPSLPKPSPSKIVAQIFQTPQGPKVVIQGVNPGDLTPNQMLQLQTQIQKQLAVQQAAQKAASAKPSGTSETQSSTASPQQSLSADKTSLGNVQGISQSTPSQSPATHQTQVSTSALQASPIEALRSTTPSTVSQPLISNSNPANSRSPIPTMVSPSKVLSPPPNLPNVISKPSGFSTIPVNNNSSPLPSPQVPVVVARKSQPRKSPIKPNNLDSPPHLFSASSPIPTHSSSPLHVWNNSSNDAAAELMRPLSSEQQHVLSERKNSLKEDIMEKKKQAATQMRLEAQREVQEKARALEMARVEEEKRHQQQNLMNNEGVNVVGGRGAKKRKLENEGSHSRTSSESSGGVQNVSHHKKGPRGRGAGKKRKLFCVCKTPYDKEKFYVGCDKCQNWFHGDCIGITEEMSRDLPEYICDDCKDDKLYCFCKKPYNESQFYIQCDKCDDWFHGRCVGVLQGESDSIGDYICPTCEPDSPINFPNSKPLDTTDYMSLNRLLKELLTNRASIPFRKPVTKSQAPNYFAIIKEPMDLQTVSNRVEDRQYNNLRDFISDVAKIFENCRYYNDVNSDIYRHADNLEKIFITKIWAIRESLNKRQH